MEALDVKPDELKAAIELIRSGKGRRAIEFRTAAEVLQAVQLHVIDKKEARRLLGLTARRQPRALKAARLERFGA